MGEQKPGDAIDLFSGYVREFHSHYRERDEFRERFDIWRGLLDKHSVPGGLSIDMGCGPGVFSFYLADKGGTVVGVDGSQEMVVFCEARRVERGLENVRFMRARLPAVDDASLTKADLLISSSVVEYVEDLDETLALFSRLLKPGATLIVSMPNVFCVSRVYERLKYRLTGQPPIYEHIRHFTSPRLLARRVRRLGLSLGEVRYYAHFTRVAKLTRRLRLPLPLTEDLFVAVFRRL